MQTAKRPSRAGIDAPPCTYLDYLKLGSKETSLVDCIKTNIALAVSMMKSAQVEPILNDIEQLIFQWEQLPAEEQRRVFAKTSHLQIDLREVTADRPMWLVGYLTSL